MENLPAKQQSQNLFFNVERFELAQRVAKVIAINDFVPDIFKGDKNIGNRMILLNYAERLNCDPIMLSQKLYIVHGKPGVEAQLKIGLANASGRFTPLKWKHVDEDTDKWRCTAYAKDKESGEILEFTLDWATVKRERWLDKSGSKWKTIPKKMMMYRSGSWWCDLYCPEVTLGLPSADELEDAIEIEPITVTSDLEQKILSAPSEKEPEPTGENEFICSICGFEAVSKRGLAKHTTMSHSQEIEPPVTMITPEQRDKLFSFLPASQIAALCMWNYGQELSELSAFDAESFIMRFDEIFAEFKKQEEQDEGA